MRVVAGNLPKYNDGRVHLLSLMQKSAYMRVRKLLEADPRRQMPLQEALEICVSCGMSTEEGSTLLHQLHDVGAILLFKNVRAGAPVPRMPCSGCRVGLQGC